MIDQGAHKLGDVLRAAREAKGVDLLRVERETKIRERYLSALERGEYRELPGSVYTKGFLRNYGAYLGQDPEYLIDLYRLETSPVAERSKAPTPPRPLSGRRGRAFVLTPGVVVGAILTVIVGAFVAYLAFEIINFARMPELRITSPPGEVNGYTETSITIRGSTVPNAVVVVDDLRENPTVVADAEGDFDVTVGLVPGSNVVTLRATDPETLRESAAEQRTITVVTDADADASPTPVDVALELAEPADEAKVTGPVPISGTAQPGSSVTITASLTEPRTPAFTVTDASGAAIAVDPATPEPPEPMTLEVDAGGSFSGSIPLPPGTWNVTVSADGSEPVTRSVVAQPPEGLSAVLRLAGGDSYLEVDVDGAAVPELTGTIAADGETIDLEADGALRIRAGNAGAVDLTINGIGIGVMGNPGAVVEWRITRAGD